MTTKEEILDYFKNVNVFYNDCTRYDDLSKMLDRLEKESYLRGLNDATSGGVNERI